MNNESSNQNINNSEVVNNPVNNNFENKSETIEMVEIANDTTESKGVLNDDTTTKPGDDLSDKTIATVNKLINTNDYTSQFGIEEVNKYKMKAILCYIPLVAFYFKYATKLGKESKYMDYHIKEGLNLSLFWIFTFIVSKLLYTLFTKRYLMSEVTPVWVNFTTYLLYCLSIVLSLVGLYRTYNGKSKDLPIIGKYKFLK